MKIARFGIGIGIGIGLLICTSAYAADMPMKAPPAAAVSLWEYEIGARYFFSGGEYRKNLFDPLTTSQLNSRLTYNRAAGHSVEMFGRVDSSSGWFFKGYAGVGIQNGGNLQDEDFPPALTPYSSTNSAMKDGGLGYANADVGYSFFRGQGSKFGAFAGFHYLHEKYNGYGCTQTATNVLVCVPAIPTSTLVLSETADWYGVRIGLTGQTMLTDRVKFSAEAAYLPYVWLDAFDNHWLRPDINPLTETGHGWGFQAEAILSYAVTQNFNVGLGGRYWLMQTTTAHTQFPGFPPSPMNFRSERYGGFLQGSYKF